MRGQRHIWDGRKQVRTSLYQVAFIATRFDPALKALRQRLEAAGKPFKVALSPSPASCSHTSTPSSESSETTCRDNSFYTYFSQCLLRQEICAARSGVHGNRNDYLPCGRENDLSMHKHGP